MGLFKKKAGGTFFGNLLRAGASKATGGVLGTGANRIEVGQTKTNAELAAEQGDTSYNQYDQRLINDLIPPDRTNTLYWVVGGLAVAILGVLAYTQGLFKGTGYKKKVRR
jgi:hypothetical protein